MGFQGKHVHNFLWKPTGFVLYGIHIGVCNIAKTLELVLGSNLAFSDHVTHTIQRAWGRLIGLYRLNYVRIR